MLVTQLKDRSNSHVRWKTRNPSTGILYGSLLLCHWMYSCKLAIETYEEIIKERNHEDTHPT